MKAAARASPLVSVIVPAFNAELTLRESVQSALAGSYRDIELIVVDDGSTDGTAAVGADLARTDPRVRFHRQPNGGPSAALNAGLAMARGDYFARLDADDLWHPAKLERQISLALAQPDLAFIYCWVRYIDAEGRVIRDIAPQRFPRWALCRGVYESLVGANSSALMRRSLVVEAGGYDEMLASWEDLLLQLTISARHPIGYVPEYLVGYRVRQGSLSSDPQNMLASWRVARQRIGQLPVPKFVLRWAHGKRCAMFAEGFAWQGRYAACAALLAEAIRYDPMWTERFLRYRVRRRLKRRSTPPREQAHRPRFFDCAPEEQVPPDDGGPDQSDAMLALEVRRTRRLARLDEQIARQTHGAA